jgi:hypothetical protein
MLAIGCADAFQRTDLDFFSARLVAEEQETGKGKADDKWRRDKPCHR